MNGMAAKYFQVIARRIFCPAFVLYSIFSFAHTSPPRNGFPFALQAGGGASLAQDVLVAKNKLQAGVNSWDLALLKTARDMFIGGLMKAESENAYLLCHIALADYRLITFYLSSSNNKEAEKCLAEAQKYLERAMTLDPEFAEAGALYGYLLGFEIALHPEKAMSLGIASFEYFAKALAKEPENPRIHLLQGISRFYTPQEFGGGADRAIESLAKAASLFEKEVVTDPLKPSWGKDEAYTFLGTAYKQKKDYEKAREMLKKALQVNPDFGLAKRELNSLDKN